MDGRAISLVEIIVPGAPDPDAPPVSRPAPVAIVDDFLPAGLAAAMRQAIDAHFASPNAHRGVLLGKVT